MPGPTLNIPQAQPPNAAGLTGARSGRPSPLGGTSDTLSAGDFASRLGKFQRPEDANDDPARSTAKELIAQGLVLPMLKMARESAFKSEMFHGGQGEKAFGAELDQRLARQVAERVAPELVEAVYKQVHSGERAAGPTDAGNETTARPGNTAPASAPGREVDRHG